MDIGERVIFYVPHAYDVYKVGIFDGMDKRYNKALSVKDKGSRSTVSPHKGKKFDFDVWSQIKEKQTQLKTLELEMQGLFKQLEPLVKVVEVESDCIDELFPEEKKDVIQNDKKR